MSDPRAGEADLTAKAKIRNAALDLYAEHGEERVSMRAVAAAAGVTVGLVQHHFKTKDGLRRAVEELIVEYHRAAIASVPNDGTPAEVAAARDAAVRAMLNDNPVVVGYMRRVLLDPNSPTTLLRQLTELARDEVSKMRDAGLASTRRSVAEQTVAMMVRNVGQLFLQPMVDAMWGQLVDGPADDAKPALTVDARN
ncbi:MULTISPECIES: TetR/AcrR family transcriptional regulator [Gordonia]|uniref:TetR/AcrR family transcriptional regulator n=2 Tax=Gordonia TaxID=2053 RepID=A0ABN3HJM7_9ACTN|nr:MULTISPECIES: TetR/AcrR family transcriptional regulator [Gordonia]AUH67950.1 TetR/AcrR family transcriptional regulator [Gordonia sp. YC-JH1]KJR08827.1 TetR family transcriptional regulator [Gordonia sihwensis]KXT58638.1 TetR family transcriptional regulator [Gordonia sp. QH-12]MBY4571684.1 TetR family transcriptional regulator [Gordonia sihwensis]GAC60787.1 putative TetR family transcriptional regulator [Gordonia sihwensis NBRC 108236]